MWSARFSSTTIRTAARDRRRVDAVQLQAARPLALGERDHAQRLRVALDQRPRGDHLADVQAAPPCSRQSRRNATLVMPAMGASTTGGSHLTWTDISGLFTHAEPGRPGPKPHRRR